MTESIRPSAGEEARAAARAADQKKQTKQSQTLAGQQGALQSGQTGQNKKLQASPFDEMLKHASESGQAANLLPSENKFDSRLKEITHDDDRHSSSSDRDKAEDDKKAADNKPEAGKKSKETGLSARERVLGKHSSGEQGSGGGSGEKREGGSGGQKGFQKDSQTSQGFAADLRRRDAAPTPAPVPVEFQKIQQVDLSQIESPQAPRELPKALLDQIVQSVTIVQKKDLSKEIQIDFHDSVFNGLRLKVTAQGKEVSVEFLVPNRSVEETFKNERENIALALGEKGVDVRSIKVTRL
ncbi:MAG TPA: hypothetical protein VJR29_09575 [bacterium]|nr:hypothetical protein [bacterium]